MAGRPELLPFFAIFICLSFFINKIILLIVSAIYQLLHIKNFQKQSTFFIFGTKLNKNNLHIMYDEFTSNMKSQQLMYGGYGGYGSSYSSYGGGYGSSYGGYGNYGSYGGYGTTGMNRMGMQNNAQGNNGQPNVQQPPNQRRIMMEEYFKMMGGLRSMVQIGFSLVALGNFTTQSWQLLKKIVSFLVKTSQSLALKVSKFNIFGKTANNFIKQMGVRSGSTMQDKFLFAIRILSAISVLLCIKLRKEIESQAQIEREEILKQYKEAKQEQQKMEDSKELEGLHQKEGYF